VYPGIDTSGVPVQAFFEPGRTDSFATYPYLHPVHGLPHLVYSMDAFRLSSPVRAEKPFLNCAGTRTSGITYGAA
jgi:hypothetical protein